MNRTVDASTLRRGKTCCARRSARLSAARARVLAVATLVAAAQDAASQSPSGSPSPAKAQADPSAEEVLANVPVTHAPPGPLAGKLTGEIAAIGARGTILLADLRTGAPEALTPAPKPTVTIDRFDEVVGFSPGDISEATLPAREVTAVERLPQGGLQLSTQLGGRLLIYPDGRLLRYNSLGKQALDAHVSIVRAP